MVKKAEAHLGVELGNGFEEQQGLLQVPLQQVEDDRKRLAAEQGRGLGDKRHRKGQGIQCFL